MAVGRRRIVGGAPANSFCQNCDSTIGRDIAPSFCRMCSYGRYGCGRYCWQCCIAVVLLDATHRVSIGFVKIIVMVNYCTSANHIDIAGSGGAAFCRTPDICASAKTAIATAPIYPCRHSAKSCRIVCTWRVAYSTFVGDIGPSGRTCQSFSDI